MTNNNSERGESKLYYDSTNNIDIAQWHDNKVVTVVSTLGVGGIVPVKRRFGADIIDLSTKKCVREYQKFMGGVDRGDQIRETGAGFCRKSHFKKWYSKSFFAVCDFMLLNSYLSWNLATDSTERNGKRHLWTFQFYSTFAEDY